MMKDKVKVCVSSPDAEAAENKSLVQHWGCYCAEKLKAKSKAYFSASTISIAELSNITCMNSVSLSSLCTVIAII